MKLAVSVGEGDPLEAGRLEAGAQRRPIATVRLMLEQPYLRPPGSLVADDRGSIVPTPIVDHEDLIVLSEQRQGGVRLGDRFPNARRLVAGGQDQAQFPRPR